VSFNAHSKIGHISLPNRVQQHVLTNRAIVLYGMHGIFYIIQCQHVPRARLCIKLYFHAHSLLAVKRQ